MLGEPQQHNTTATQHKVDYVVHNIIVLSPNAWKTDIDVNVSPVPLDEETKAGCGVWFLAEELVGSLAR
jgi:hypothetical protein